MFKTILSFVVAGSLMSPAGADPLHWVLRQYNHELKSIASDGHTFVAVGARGAIITSTDGETWRLHNDDRNELDDFNGVAAGKGKFVLVGDHGVVMTSTNGESWSLHSAKTSSKLTGVRFQNGKFIASSLQNDYVSIDGTSWRATAPSENAAALVFGNEHYLSILNHRVRVSTDGNNWRPSEGLSLNHVAFGQGRFIGVGLAGVVFSSSDGQNWTQLLSVQSKPIATVRFVNGQFVALGQGCIETSPDGRVWTQRELPLDAGLENAWLKSIAYFKGLYLIVGEDGELLESSDAMRWAVQKTDVANRFGALAAGPDFLLSVGRFGRGVNNHFLSSTDGRTWVKHEEPTLGYVHNLIYANGRFLGCGYEGAPEKIFTSLDGNTWTGHICNNPNEYKQTPSINNVAFGNNVFVAAGDGELDGKKVGLYLSRTGDDWSQLSIKSEDWMPFSGIAYGSGQFVAVCQFGQVATSGDGLNWSFSRPLSKNKDAAVATSMVDVAFGNGCFVGLDGQGVIFSTP